jgi:hypothetical protein
VLGATVAQRTIQNENSLAEAGTTKRISQEGA